MKQSRGRAVLGGTIFAATIAVAGYAFTASNSVPDTKAGAGAGAVTGYDVTGVHYGLNSSDPTKADTVTFTLDSAPVANSTFKAQLVTDGTWYTCTATTTAATCATTGQAVLDVDTLHIVIAQ